MQRALYLTSVAICPGLGIALRTCFDVIAGYYSVRSCNIGCCQGGSVTQFITVGHIAKLAARIVEINSRPTVLT